MTPTPRSISEQRARRLTDAFSVGLQLRGIEIGYSDIEFILVMHKIGIVTVELTDYSGPTTPKYYILFDQNGLPTENDRFRSHGNRSTAASSNAVCRRRNT